MHGLTVNKHRFLTLMLIGFALVNVALFLHPMSPEDFLELAVNNPIATVVDPQGSSMALVFWGGILLSLAGVAGLLERISLRRHTGPKLQSVGAMR